MLKWLCGEGTPEQAGRVALLLGLIARVAVVATLVGQLLLGVVELLRVAGRLFVS